MNGRYAPSPTSALHLGNLRTALVAWLFARRSGGSFQLRIEDIDTLRVSAAGNVARQQESDLLALGLDFDGEVVWQSERLDAYAAALAGLETYECFCTRKEIADAASAPNGDGYRPYTGTCLRLTEARRAELAATRRPALRVHAGGESFTVTDLWAGEVSRVVDDFVVVRNDGVPAYNLAVVVDDLAMGVEQVVRADDLLSSSPRQGWLTSRLGGVPRAYAHVPLVVNTKGQRLAKRDGAISLADLAALGVGPADVLSRLAASLNLAEPGEPVIAAQLLQRFDPEVLPRSPWVVA